MEIEYNQETETAIPGESFHIDLFPVLQTKGALLLLTIGSLVLDRKGWHQTS